MSVALDRHDGDLCFVCQERQGCGEWIGSRIHLYLKVSIVCTIVHYDTVGGSKKRYIIPWGLVEIFLLFIIFHIIYDYTILYVI